MTELTNIDLPNNWIIAKLSDMVIDPKSDFVDGPFGSNLKANEYRDEGVPVFRIQNIKAGYFLDKNIQFVTPQKAEQIKRHSFKFGDIIITKLGEPLGLCCKVPAKYPSGIIVADLMRVRPSDIIVNTDYLVYAINSKIIQDQFKKITKGTTRARVNLTIVRDIEIPLAPLNEQNRIVDKLDELLSELEKGKEQLLTSLEQLKVYRQSILKHAFEGKLFNPDSNKDELPNGWKKESFNDVSTKIGDIDHKMPKKVEDGIYPYLSTGDISDENELDFTKAKKITREDYVSLSRKIKPEKDDIIFPRYGTIGRNVLVKTDKEFLVSYSCAIIKPNKEKILPKYLYYYSLSPQIKKEIEKYIVQTTQANVGISSIKLFEIKYPVSLDAQEQIVVEIEQVLSNSKKTEAELINNLTNANVLKQSLLQKAFEGKLVEQDPTDESASVLLERIKKERGEYLRVEKVSRKNQRSPMVSKKKVKAEL